MAGRPALFNSPEQLRQAIDQYFSDQSNRPFTVTGLALYLGFCDRQSLYDYQEREEYSCLIKEARLRVENEYEQALFGKMPTGAIFALKNMGWKDKSEVENSGTQTFVWKEEKVYETEQKADNSP